MLAYYVLSRQNKPSNWSNVFLWKSRNCRRKQILQKFRYFTSGQTLSDSKLHNEVFVRSQRGQEFWTSLMTWFVFPQVFWGHCINALIHSIILFWFPLKVLEHGKSFIMSCISNCCSDLQTSVFAEWGGRDKSQENNADRQFHGLQLLNLASYLMALRTYSNLA